MLTIDILNSTLIGSMFAVIAYVICIEISEPDMILFNLKQMLVEKIGYKDDGSKRISWFLYRIYECEKCFAGQIAFWWYLVYSLEMGLYELNLVGNIVIHIYVISISIFMTSIVTKLARWAKN